MSSSSGVPAHAASGRGSRLAHLASVVLVVVILTMCVGALGWRLTGGRLLRVDSPSMGTRAPVGSLLWVRPVSAQQLRPGDFISFRPPSGDATYSHLIRAVGQDGTISTGGLLSGDDPWRLRPADVIGRVVMVWQGVGWVSRAAPVLLGGAVLVALTFVAVSRRRPSWRTPVIVIGGSLVLAVATAVYHPLLSAERLALAPGGPGNVGATATYVGTGLLPVRVAVAGGGGVPPSDVVLGNGQVASVLLPPPNSPGGVHIHLAAAVPTAFWVVLILACFVPALVDTSRTVLVWRLGRRPPRGRRARGAVAF